jgi:hypothetical protein
MSALSLFTNGKEVRSYRLPDSLCNGAVKPFYIVVVVVVDSLQVSLQARRIDTVASPKTWVAARFNRSGRAGLCSKVVSFVQ